MSDTISIKVSVSTQLVNSKVSTTFEVDREEWEEMSASEREETCRDILFQGLINWDFEEV